LAASICISITTAFITTAIGLLRDHFKSLFSEADLYITNDLAAKLGVRFEHSSLIGKAEIAPAFHLLIKQVMADR
jgi:vitamin B12 transporter